MHLFLIGLVLLAASPCFAAQDLQDAARREFRDGAVIPFFQKANPQIASFTTFFKKALDSRHTLLLVLGTPHLPATNIDRSELQSTWWDKDDLLGVFLMDNADPSGVWELAILPWEAVVSPGYGEGHIEVDRVDIGSLVLRLTVTDYGLPTELLQLFFDADSKRLLGQIRYSPVAMGKIISRVVRRQNERARSDMYFVSTTGENIVAAWDWAKMAPAIVADAEAKEVLGDIASDAEGIISIGGPAHVP
jgi:hypothetical protein